MIYSEFKQRYKLFYVHCKISSLNNVQGTAKNCLGPLRIVKYMLEFFAEFLHDRYSILAPNVIPQGFVDGKVVTEKVITALQLDQNEFRLGHTKIFFRAGVLGMLEDMRDERLAKIFSNFQARIRGYLIRKNYKKLQEQRRDSSCCL